MLSKRPREGSLLFLLIGNRRERRPGVPIYCKWKDYVLLLE